MYSVHILNGRSGNDEGVGDFTFIGSSGSSVIDYAIYSDELRKSVKYFAIGERTESCHFPVKLSININNKMNCDSVNQRATSSRLRYDFSNSNIANYRKSLEDDLKSGKMAELLSDIYSKEADINHIISKCQTLLIDNSENCRKQYRKCELKHEPWFNSECKTLKQGKTKSLREYRKARTVNNLDKYKQARNNFKQKCKTEKENYYSHKLESLIESSENPKSF